MLHCAIIPKVRDSKGNLRDSKLFKDLLSFLPSRKKTVEVYQKTKSQEFITNWNPKLVLDDAQEPTFRSMLKQTNLNKYVPDSKIKERLNKEIGYYKKGTDEPELLVKTPQRVEELESKAIQFNSYSEFNDEWVANVVNLPSSDDKEYVNVRVEKRDELNSLNAEKMEYNHRLNTKLRGILESHGVSVGNLTQLEEDLGIYGVTDFSKANEAATGLVELIRVAKGERGEASLPEEFAHFALRALGDHPLKTRLINLIVDKGLASQIIGDEYDDYTAKYEGNEAKLAEEAAGKLLARHLLNEAKIPEAQYKSLLERLIQAIKNFFSKFNASDIKQAMIDADTSTNRIAKSILSGSLDEAISLDNIKADQTKLYDLGERIARDKTHLRKIIDNELKRLKIYEKRNPDSPFSIKQRLLVDRLESTLRQGNEIDGIYSFLDNALEELSQVHNRLLNMAATRGTDITEKARVLRDIRNYYYSYSNVVDMIKDSLIDEEREEDNRYGDRVRVAIDNVKTLLDNVKIEYQKEAMPIFVDFLRPFIGESLTVPFGKYKGKTVTAQQLVTIANEDISFFDRWLDSMADSSSSLLKIMDQAVKTSKENARLNTINYRRRLEAALVALEKAGVKSVEWMFETDSKGNKTGNYISEIDYGKYREEKDKLLQRLKEKYGDNPTGDDAAAFNAERRAWYEANLETFEGGRRPKMSIYGSKAYHNMNAAQRAYYNTIMEIKGELDAMLPTGYTHLTNAIKIRKDLIERVKSSSNVREGGIQIWEAIKDQFIRRTDDTDFGDKAALQDFEGNEVQMLPIYYTKLKNGESNNDISTDVTSTMLAYAAMANDFKEMNKVIDVLEVGRDILRDKFRIEKTQGGKPLVERFEMLGRKVEQNLLKPRSEARILERLDDFFRMQVYQRYMADEGSIGKVDVGKAANFVNRVTSLNMLGLNILSGISNIATGKVMMRIESFCGQFFNEKDTLTADNTYRKELPSYLAELGKRVKTSKIALWDELFNVMQEYETDVKEANFDRKTWFSRMFGTSALFFMNNAGEHWMQNRTSLALANHYKMKDSAGNIVSLWDAMEVVYTDPSDHSKGASLQLKKGYTKEDGSAFTNADIIAFSRKSAAINQRMHGIYNKADRSAVQRLAIGRLAIIFRKWIKPSLNRRFASAGYNYDIQEWTEGYYRTLWHFLKQAAKEIREGQFSWSTWKANAHDTEKANIVRALTELGHFLILLAFLGIMDWDDDDKKDNWFMNMLEYQARRLKTELGAMIPGPQMTREAFTILKSPAAGVKTAEGFMDLIGLFNPYNYESVLGIETGGEEALLKSGRYKGHTRAYRLFFESPVIPMNKTIYRGLHPEESIPFFKQ